MKLTICAVVLSIGLTIMSCAGDHSKKTDNQTVPKDITPLVITPDHVENITLNDSIFDQLSKRGKEIAGKTKLALKIELKKAIKEGGLEYAISFCNRRAMEITDSIAMEEQVMIKRLAKKNRNPYNAMDADESRLYRGYVIQNLNGRALQPMLGWNDLRQPVFYYPIPMNQICLNCHGKIGEDITPSVAEKINGLYPEDKAVDFAKNHLRGMWSITFPEYKVVDVKQVKVIQQ